MARTGSAGGDGASQAAMQHNFLLDHVSPATRLLEKRRQMFEIQEALEAQKEEFARWVELCCLYVVPPAVSERVSLNNINNSRSRVMSKLPTCWFINSKSLAQSVSSSMSEFCTVVLI